MLFFVHLNDPFFTQRSTKCLPFAQSCSEMCDSLDLLRLSEREVPFLWKHKTLSMSWKLVLCYLYIEQWKHQLRFECMIKLATLNHTFPKLFSLEVQYRSSYLYVPTTKSSTIQAGIVDTSLEVALVSRKTMTRNETSVSLRRIKTILVNSFSGDMDSI